MAHAIVVFLESRDNIVQKTLHSSSSQTHQSGTDIAPGLAPSPWLVMGLEG